MGIIKMIKRKFIKNDEFSIPNKFEITEQEINEFSFYYRGKSLTPERELQREGKKIDTDIVNYMKKNKAQILNSHLSEFNIKAIIVRNLTYNYADINHSLKKYDSKDSIFNMCHPSRILLESFEKNKEISLFNYLRVCAGTWIEYKEIKYLDGNSLSFTNKTHFLQGERDSNNIEIAFINTEEEHHETTSKASSLYIKPNLFRKNNHPFKGIIIQNFTLSDDAMNSLEMIDKKFEQICTSETESFIPFEKLAFELHEHNSGRIAFIARMNDKVLIQGRDWLEKNVYTTISEQYLPDILKDMQRNKANHAINYNNNYTQIKVEENESLNQDQK